MVRPINSRKRGRALQRRIVNFGNPKLLERAKCFAEFLKAQRLKCFTSPNLDMPRLSMEADTVLCSSPYCSPWMSKIDRTCDEKRLLVCAKRCKIKLSQTRQFKFWRGVRVHCVTLPLTLKLRGNNQSCKFMIDNYKQMFYNCLIVRRATWEMKTKN